MPARKKRSGATRNKTQPPFAWGMLAAGIGLGFALGLLINLLKPFEANPKKPATKTTSEEALPQPKFEFYSILPELEVVIPDTPPRTRIEELINSTDPVDVELLDVPHYLQTGSFKSLAEADRMKATLTLLGLNVGIEPVRVNDTIWHRVRLGPFNQTSALEQARQRLIENKVDFITVKRKS